jgi:uncharacterized protein YecE (DUF72 family)
MSASETSFPRVAVGCAELPPGMSRAAYFRRLPLLEMRLPGDRVPADRAAERWSSEAGNDGRHVFVAPRWMCRFHAGDAEAAIAEGVAELARIATQVRAAAVVFPTPPDLSPSSAHRDALRRFFAELATAERFSGDGASPVARVWQPDGLWRPAVAAAFAAELGVVATVDPLAPDPLEDGIPAAPDDVAYARVTGLGRPNRPLGTDDLIELAEWVSQSERAFIVFATPTRLKDAVALAREVTNADAD